MISFIWHFELVPNASNVSVAIFEVISQFFQKYGCFFGFFLVFSVSLDFFIKI
jgi:hypothetical protein